MLKLKQLSARVQWSSGPFYAPGILLLCGLITILPHDAWAFDNEESRATLRGLVGIEVGVGEVLPAVARSGVTRETIRQKVTQQLRQAGMTMVNRETLLQRSDAAFLAVTVGAIRHPAGMLYAYSIDVSVYQTTMLKRDTAIVLSLPTWSTASFGIVGSTNLRGLLASIGKRVDQFLQAHRAVNPRAEARKTSRAPATVKTPRKRARAPGTVTTPSARSPTRQNT